MKVFPLLIFMLSFFAFGNSQVPKEIFEDVKKSEIGFLYYTDPEFPSFVPLKKQSFPLKIDEFRTSKLNYGFQINWNLLALDTLKKYEHAYRVLNIIDQKNPVFIKLIPVRITYTLFKYAKSDAQLARAMNEDKFKILKRFVVVKTLTGMSIRVESIEVLPLLVTSELERTENRTGLSLINLRSSSMDVCILISVQPSVKLMEMRFFQTVLQAPHW